MSIGLICLKTLSWELLLVTKDIKKWDKNKILDRMF